MSDRTEHIKKAEALLKEWDKIYKDVKTLIDDEESNKDKLLSAIKLESIKIVHTRSVELLMAAQAHATLAESMRVLDDDEEHDEECNPNCCDGTAYSHSLYI